MTPLFFDISTRVGEQRSGTRKYGRICADLIVPEKYIGKSVRVKAVVEIDGPEELKVIEEGFARHIWGDAREFLKEKMKISDEDFDLLKRTRGKNKIIELVLRNLFNKEYSVVKWFVTSREKMNEEDLDEVVTGVWLDANPGAIVLLYDDISGKGVEPIVITIAID